jgi:murein DD-endopeptidase MepM/ murein hydrolase activator NlpD
VDKGIKKNTCGFVLTIQVIMFCTLGFISAVVNQGLCVQTDNVLVPQDITPPFNGPVKYPFTKNDAIKCGHWRSASQDYPYFGAPRGGNTRKHAGIDLYPAKGVGTPIKAIGDGKVIKVAPFYTRRNGEVTYAVLVDHNDFVANYAELKKPSLSPGSMIKQKQIIGVLSGTRQLHVELYMPGTKNWSSWIGSKMPANLIDPTDMMIRIFSTKDNDRSSCGDEKYPQNK